MKKALGWGGSAATVAATRRTDTSRRGSVRINRAQSKLEMDPCAPTRRVQNHPLNLENRGFESRTGRLNLSFATNADVRTF